VCDRNIEVLSKLQMKIKYLTRKGMTIIVILLFVHKIQAQEKFIPETTIGIKQGINISKVFFNPPIDQKITTGYSGGIIFKHISQENLGIQIELNFFQQGWTEKLDTTDSYFRRLNQINLSFMTHIELGKEETKFLINLGPTLSYLISEKESIKLINPKDAQTYYGEKINNILEFGLCFGFGFVKTTPIGSFQFESRFNQNLSDIFRTVSDPTTSSSKIQSVELSISYLIKLKKTNRSNY